jgi:hypothetical protein
LLLNKLGFIYNLKSVDDLIISARFFQLIALIIAPILANAIIYIFEPAVHSD